MTTTTVTANLKLAPRRSIWDRVVSFAEACHNLRELNALANVTDAELAARGTTRDSELRRLVGLRSYI